VPETLVDVDAVTFSYGSRPVLKGIAMQVPRGKVVAIMGGSGCGKTTLLRLIGGQLRPTSGAVRVAGHAVHELDREGLYRLRRRMSMLFQFGALFTDMTVFDNVAFPCASTRTCPRAWCGTWS
jgi:phospholipid/cholesterol/gamma-HCH transport system ATP-binding protein